MPSEKVKFRTLHDDHPTGTIDLDSYKYLTLVMQGEMITFDTIEKKMEFFKFCQKNSIDKVLDLHLMGDPLTLALTDLVRIEICPPKDVNFIIEHLKNIKTDYDFIVTCCGH